MSAPPVSLSGPRRPCVVVVGAGLSGLGAASRLVKRGCDVIVLERSAAPGGRCAGEWESGFSIDRAIPALTHADRHLIQWIDELGISGAMLPLRLLQLGQVHNGEVRSIDPSTRGGIARIPGVRTLDGMRLVRLPRLVRRYRDRVDPDRPERAARWDDRSLADFARLYFGRTSFERWIAPEAMSTFLSDAHETSRVGFLLQWIHGSGARGRPGVPQGALHEVPRAAAEPLDVRYAHEASRIERASDGYVVHAHSAEAGGRDVHFEADAVVVAIAAGDAERVAAPLVAPAERDILRDVSYAPSVTLTVALERPLSGLPQQVRVPHVERAPIETYLCEPGTRGGRAPEHCGIVTVATTEAFALAHAGAGDDVVEKVILECLGRWHSRIGGLVRFTRLHRQRRAVPHFQVGAYRQLERFQNVQADLRSGGRRLYFAGDHLSGPRAENALGSGLRVAEELLSDLA